MNLSMFDALLGAAQNLRAEQADAVLCTLETTLGQIADALEKEGNLTLTSARDWESLHTACEALSAAVHLRPAAKALQTVHALPPQNRRGREIVRNLALGQTLRALTISHRSASMHLDMPVTHPVAPVNIAPETPVPQSPSHLAALDNIARCHREHERFYSAYLLEQGALLAREANKLKVLADLWMQGDVATPYYPGVEFSNAAYRVAGCDDLNPLPSVAFTGILFMEGQGEPTEMRVLKAQLGSRSAGSAYAGKWLADAMIAAWTRESAMLNGSTIDAAEPRLRTIVTNWVGAQETVLVGKLLGVTAEILSSIDFSPAAIRGQRKTFGKRLETAGRVLTAAAQIQANSGADLSSNDECWTLYRARLNVFFANAG